MRRLPILIPHRPGCADFPLPVLHGRASLAEVQMTPSVTCRQRKTRGRTSALVSSLASSATRCRFVDRFVRLKVLSRVSRQSIPCLCPALATPAEPTIPRLLDGLVDAVPALPTAKTSALNEFRGSVTRLWHPLPTLQE